MRILWRKITVLVITMGICLLQLPAIGATYQTFGTWSLGVTNSGTTSSAINTSDSSTMSNGVVITVTVQGTGTAIFNDRNETLTTRGGTTSMFVNGVSTAASAIALITMCDAACIANGPGKSYDTKSTFTFSFADSLGNPVNVAYPVLNISGIGGNTAGVANWTSLTLTNPGLTMSTLVSNGNMQVVGGTVLQPVSTTSTQSCTVAPIAACGSIMIAGTASSFTFAATYNNNPSNSNAGAFGSGDAFDLLMSVDSSFGVSYNANFPAAAFSGSTSGSVPASLVGQSQGSTPNSSVNTGNLAVTGYTPTGWCTVTTTPGQSCTSAGGVAYTYGDPLSPLVSDLVLYEMWSPNSNTITFNPSGATTGSTSPGTITTGVPTALTANGYSNSGYFFAGWCTVPVVAGASCAGTRYADTASVAVNQSLTLYAEWISDSATFSLSYNANYPASSSPNGGTLPTTVTGIVALSTTTPVSANVLTATGYVSAGWCTVMTTPGQSCTSAGGTAYTTGNLASVRGDVVLYGAWTPASFNVTFNANGGTETVTSQVFAFQVAQALSANTMAYSGNTFTGWCTVQTSLGGTCASAGGTLYAAGASFTTSGPVTLWAVWATASSYVVNVYNNSACGSSSNTGATTPAGSTPLISTFGSTTITCTNAAYTFAGWCTTQPATLGAACPNTSILYATSATTLQPVYATVNLYASWNLVLSLTYNANSGTGSVPATVTNLSVGATPTVSVQGSLTRTGYVFAGWNTAANGTGTAYAASGSVTLVAMSANVTLYAQWQALLTLSYNSSIGLNAGSVPASVTGIVPGATPSVAGNTGNMVATGYAFGGWCTVTLSAGTACSGTTYQGGDTLAAMTTAKTLYAIWVTAYSVTYLTSWGPTTGTLPSTLIGQLAGATPTVSGNTGNITFTNYAFAGWCTTNSSLGAVCSGTSYQGGATLPPMAANVTLYARWSPVYTLTYYNGYTAPSGTLPAGSTGLAAGSTPTVSGNTGNLTYTGMSFAGWCTVNLSATTACTGTVYQGGSTLAPMAGNVTLYAIWGWSVTYNANYPASTTGQGVVPATVTGIIPGTTVQVSSNTGLLTATSRQFLGWATTAGAASATYPAANPGNLPSASANVTLYAVWGLATTYTLTYNANFPASTTDTGTAPAQLTGLIAATTWTVSSNSGSLSVVGYTFGGWNTAANGTGTPYAASGAATLTMPAANVNLYATWAINTFILTTTQVGSGGVSSAPAGITLAAPGSTTGTYNYNTSVVLTETPATGWSFTGWTGACTGTATTCTVSMTQARSVTGTFTVIQTVRITYAVGRGTGRAPDPQDVYANSGTTLPSGSSLQAPLNQVFTGWLCGQDTRLEPAVYVPLTDVTCTAQYALAEVLLGDVFYGTDKWDTADPAYRATIARVATAIVAGNYITITITGMADIRGNADWNMFLATNRAKTAMQLLQNTLIAMRYTKAKFVLRQLGVSTQYSGYSSNRRASITGTAGR